MWLLPVIAFSSLAVLWTKETLCEKEKKEEKKSSNDIELGEVAIKVIIRPKCEDKDKDKGKGKDK